MPLDAATEKHLNAWAESALPSEGREAAIADEGLAVGQWYWVKGSTTDEPDAKAWLGCIVRIGSNYAKIVGPTARYGGHYESRIHFSEFFETCTPEPNAIHFIQNNVERYREKSFRLMSKVQELTRSLSIAPRDALSDGSETQALALRGSNQPVGEYKTALIKAKDETLPELFKKVREANEAMGSWMKAALIPMEAELKALEPAIKLIKDRIFNVELYAGLIEQVVQIKGGEPAAISEPVRIFQRRAYMDEECLARYESGGMEFKDIKAFDTWIINPQNLKRLLPFPRCILAFQVRRKDKERGAVSLSDFIIFAEQADKSTFLYMRNGDQVFRLETGIEFGAQLFPDIERSKLDGVIYAKKWGSSIDYLISENEYKEIVKKEREAVREYNNKTVDLKKRKVPRMHWPVSMFGPTESAKRDYIKWTPETVHYDDISAYVQSRIDEHNRLVLVLQGLFDRSPIFHPHPPYQLWIQEGFQAAIQLIYDDSRALTIGDKPDFERYRAYLNSSLKPGDVTVGQEEYWERVEAEKENRRRDSDYRWKSDYRVTRFTPYGNPGPGRLAVVHSITSRGCVYKWQRERVRYSRYGSDIPIGCSLTVPFSEVLNCSSYLSGEFRQFYADPRTRSEYTIWADLLLTAEEFVSNGMNWKKKRKK